MTDEINGTDETSITYETGGKAETDETSETYETGGTCETGRTEETGGRV